MKQPRFAEKLSAALRRGKTAPASENSAASAKATPASRSGASLPARASRGWKLRPPPRRTAGSR